jgi:ubiquinone biosynthesis monooxygenase Coq6
MTSDEFIDAINSAFWQEHTQSPLVKKSCELLSNLNIRNTTGPRIYPPSILDVVEKSRAAFPLGFGHSAFYVSRRTALIGYSIIKSYVLLYYDIKITFSFVVMLLTEYILLQDKD